MIEITKSFSVGTQCYKTLEEAQRAALMELFDKHEATHGGPHENKDVRNNWLDAACSTMLSNAASFADILTMKPSSRPAARKAHGAVRKPKSKPAADKQTP